VHEHSHSAERDLIGEPDLAQRHFSAAEHRLREAIDAGEVYTLGALATLHLDAGVNLDEAAALARRNLEFNRTPAARALLNRAEAAPARSP
jgi:hypothetical protein